MLARIFGKTVLPILLCISIIIPIIPAASATTAVSDGAVFPVEKTVYPSELLAGLVSDLSELEARFADAEWNKELTEKFTVKYDETLLTDLICVDVTNSDGSVTVSVYAETYEDYNITWIPASAKLTDGVTVTELELDDSGKGSITLTDTDASSIKISVDYRGETNFTKKEIQVLLNAAYNAGNAGIAALKKYEEDSATYDEKLTAYEKYCEELRTYKLELEKYNEYLNSSEEYKAAVKEYNEYLTALEKYKEKLAVYEAYLEEYGKYEQEYENYLDFLQNPEKYEQAYNEYVAYCNRKDEIKAQLDCVGTIFKSDSIGNTMYYTLIEDNVTAVLKSQDALVATGCDEQDIADADRATKALIEVLNSYPPYAYHEMRYSVYKEIYPRLRDNITLLFTKLAKLYENDVVPSILESKGKLERYWQFVSQLYILHCALDDTVTFNPNWNIAGAYPADLIEDCQFVKDTNSATPKGDYPEEVSEVPNPATIKKPTPPAEVKKPTAPEEVKKPTPPTEVVKPNYPAAVPHPGEPPLAPRFSESVNEFITKIRSGKLIERVAEDSSVAAFTVTAERAVGLGDLAAIGIYEQGSAMLTDILTVEKGSGIILPEPTVAEFSDREYKYTFAGWTISEGTVADGDISVFADYSIASRKYYLTWKIEDMTVTAEYLYGSEPLFRGIMPNPDSVEYEYSFIGWSPIPVRVIEDAEYTAEYQKVRKKYTVTWKIGESTLSEEYAYGDIPSFVGQSVINSEIARLEKSDNGKFIYRFNGWDKEISAVHGNDVYTAVFSKSPIIDIDNGDVDFDIDQGEDQGSSSVKLALKTQTGAINASIDISNLLSKNKGKSVTLELDGATVHFSRTAVERIVAGKGKFLNINYVGSSIQIDVTDQDRKQISTGVVPIVTFEDDGSSGVPLLFCEEQYQVLEVAEEGITFTLTLGKVYELKRGFSVEIFDADGGECMISSDKYVVSGDTVEITLISRRGYKEGTVTVKTSDGQQIKVQTVDGVLCFTMPASNVTVTPEFERIKYKISFVSDGKPVSESEYFYGDTVTLPTDPTKDEDGEYTYTFVGWDKPVRAVDGDETYNAVFLSVPIIVEDAVPVQELGLVDMILIAGSSAIAAAGGILTLFFVLRRKRARRECE